MKKLTSLLLVTLLLFNLTAPSFVYAAGPTNQPQSTNIFWKAANFVTGGLSNLVKSGIDVTQNDLPQLEQLRQKAGLDLNSHQDRDYARKLAELSPQEVEQLKQGQIVKGIVPIGDSASVQAKYNYAVALKEWNIKDEKLQEEAKITGAIAIVGAGMEGLVTKAIANTVKPIVEPITKPIVSTISKFLTHEVESGATTVLRGALSQAVAKDLSIQAKEILATKGLREAKDFLEQSLRSQVSHTQIPELELQDAIYKQTAQMLDMEVFYHYTSDYAAGQIVESGVIKPSSGALMGKGVFVTDIPPHIIQPTRGGWGNSPTSLLDSGMQLGNKLGLTHQVGVKARVLEKYFVIYAPKGTFRPDLDNKLGFIREWLTNKEAISLTAKNIIVDGPHINPSINAPPPFLQSALLSSTSIAGVTGGITVTATTLASALGGTATNKVAVSYPAQEPSASSTTDESTPQLPSPEPTSSESLTPTSIPIPSAQLATHPVEDPRDAFELWFDKDQIFLDRTDPRSTTVLNIVAKGRLVGFVKSKLGKMKKMEFGFLSCGLYGCNNRNIVYHPVFEGLQEQNPVPIDIDLTGLETKDESGTISDIVFRLEDNQGNILEPLQKDDRGNQDENIDTSTHFSITIGGGIGTSDFEFVCGDGMRFKSCRKDWIGQPSWYKPGK